MSDLIHDRGRGPELFGTRITVYRIMDFVRDGSSPEEMASELRLTSEQVAAALAYIAAHREAVEAEYEIILKRVHGRNPEWLEADRPKSTEELKQRILARAAKESPNVDRARQ